MKPIFEYLDYRDYLKDFYEERKSRHTFFSFRLFGDKVGIDASYLAKVLIKTRHLADNSIARVADFCGLSEKEAAYFDTLVRFVKAKSHKDGKLYFEKLLSLKGVRSNPLMESQYEFYQRWHHSAIRSLLEYFDFKGDYKALGEALSPPISTREAKASVQLLEKLELIKKDPDNRYRLTDTAISTGPHWKSLAIQSFQEETIRLSSESLSRHPKDTRDVSSITMNITRADFEELRERIKEFRSTIITYVNEQSSPDCVYQLNIQLFPLTRIEERRQ
jgi:uncharacterized protein (TIGR02147 family)